MRIKEEIKELLESKEISNYKISKETGIAQTTLSNYTKGKTKISNMKFDHAVKLYEFYQQYQYKEKGKQAPTD